MGIAEAGGLPGGFPAVAGWGEEKKPVLSFLMFKAMRILVLKLSKFRNPKAFRLMTLMRLLVASSFAFE